MFAYCGRRETTADGRLENAFTVGRVDEPGCDLAVALAVASASRGVALSASPRACFGELGLTGELRWVGHPERRLAEAAKHGLRDVIAPADSGAGAGEVRTLREALAAALGGPSRGRPRTVPEPTAPALTRVEDHRVGSEERALRPAPEPAAHSS